jgi:protoheme IX farnesyltransferase
MRKQLKLIAELAKSGIVTLVLISVLAGYLIGQPAELPFDWKRLLATLMGILFLASGSSALNQWQERVTDGLMPRTATRPLPSGKLSSRAVLWFVGICLVLGLGTLYALSLVLFWLGIGAVLSYNGLYTLWWKRKWAYAAVPGAIPGALPILMGHLAATDQPLNPAGWYLFFILFFWQMPHFWALALRYQDDYQKGGFPTLPVKHGLGVTVRQITVWCLTYIALAGIAPLFIPVGWIYFIPTAFMSVKVMLELYRFSKQPEGLHWLPFFLWINFSLIVYLGAAAIDLWSIYLPIPYFTR